MLTNEKLYAKPKKCALFITQIHFLGFAVFANGVSADPEKLRPIEESMQYSYDVNVVFSDLIAKDGLKMVPHSLLFKIP